MYYSRRGMSGVGNWRYARPSFSGLGQDEYWTVLDDPIYWEGPSSHEEADYGPTSHIPADTLPGVEETYEFPFDTQDILTAAGAVLSVAQQYQLNQINLERAQRGLPPISTQQYAAQMAPAVNVGISPDTQKLLMYGGIGLLAVMMLSKKR